MSNMLNANNTHSLLVQIHTNKHAVDGEGKSLA